MSNECCFVILSGPDKNALMNSLATTFNAKPEYVTFVTLAGFDVEQKVEQFRITELIPGFGSEDGFAFKAEHALTGREGAGYFNCSNRHGYLNLSTACE